MEKIGRALNDDTEVQICNAESSNEGFLLEGENNSSL
jgi:hypothetical protein